MTLVAKIKSNPEIKNLTWQSVLNNGPQAGLFMSDNISKMVISVSKVLGNSGTKLLKSQKAELQAYLEMK